MLKAGQIQPEAHAAWPVRRLLARVQGWCRNTTFLIMLIATLQGAIYLLIIPPWFHYDEPTHFEYAWLIAHQSSLPQPGDENALLRREIIISLREHHLYDRVGLGPSSLISDDAAAFNLGFSELHHFPLYYMLVSLPLRVFSHLDIATQLYLARFISLGMFLLTIRAAVGLMTELTPAGHLLRIAVPFTLALLPPFVDAMTAVNNDVGAVLFFSLFLWAATRTIRAGLTWRRAGWVIATALVAAAMKHTALAALGLAPIVILMAFWVQRRLAWRWLIGAALALIGLGLIATIQWKEPAFWYRAPVAAPNQPQQATARLRDAAAPLVDVKSLLGQQVTIGGWIWADRPALIASPALLTTSVSARSRQTTSLPLQVTTTPTFFSLAITLPNTLDIASFVFPAEVLATEPTALQVYLDGVVVTPALFPAGQTPQFQDAAGTAGVWAGQPFTNRVRNASFEQIGPSVRPWVDQALRPFSSRLPAAIFFELLDVDRSAAITGGVLQRQITTFFFSFSWARVTPPGSFWYSSIRPVLWGAGLGCLIWLIVSWRSGDRSRRAAVLFLLLAAVPVWLNSMMRVFPTFMGTVYIPIARYGFPAIVPVVLGITGGWYSLAPKRFQPAIIVWIIVGMTLLSCMAIVGAWDLPGGRR
jgi:hypothetical protein